jgi:hypothetical protein
MLHDLAIKSFVRACETSFGHAFHARRAGSPLDRAYVKLGSDGFAEAVCVAMGAHAKRVLVDDARKNLDGLIHCGALAQQAMIADVVAGAIRDAIVSANLDAPSVVPVDSQTSHQ